MTRRFSLSLKNRLDDNTIITLDGKVEGTPARVSERVIQSRLFKVLLKVFAKYAFVKLSIVDDQVILEWDKLLAKCSFEE